MNACRGCGDPLTPMKGRGRPKVWCSAACRAKATRQPAAAPPTCLTCGGRLRWGAIADRCKRCREPKVEIPRARCQGCDQEFQPRQRAHIYCSPTCRPWTKRTTAPRGTSTERGYGAAHQRARREWSVFVESGRARCCLCGGPIAPGSKWHLDHNEDRTGYRGVAHPACNVRDGRRTAAINLLAEHYGVEPQTVRVLLESTVQFLRAG